MKRMLPALAVIASAACGYPVHKQLHVATSGTPIIIAVVSDHYTDEDEFDNDAANFITYGLLTHPYYLQHAGELQVDTFYQPLGWGEESNYGFNVDAPSQNCALSWTISDDDSNTATRVQAIAGVINPRHTIVIADHPYNIGCTEGEWTYVAVDAVGTDVLPHELGHGIGRLHDEFALARFRSVAHPGMSEDPNKDRNCHDTNPNTTPPWTEAGAGSFPECDLFGLDVVHAFDHAVPNDGETICLMGATNNANFCPVCKRYMELEFGYLRNPNMDDPGTSDPGIENPDRDNPPPPPPPGAGVGTRIVKPPPNQPANPTRKPVPPRPPGGGIVFASFVQPPPGTIKPGTPIVPTPKPVPPPVTTPVITLQPAPSPEPKPIVRLLVSFDPENGAIVAKKAFPIKARYTPSYRRLGDYVYEILDGGVPKEVGVIDENLFRSHNYQSGVGHQSLNRHPTDITIQLPDVTTAMLRASSFGISIRIYQLRSGVTHKLITPAVFAGLKKDGSAEERGKGLSAEAIRSVR